jgi:hypothetical protein
MRIALFIFPCNLDREGSSYLPPALLVSLIMNYHTKHTLEHHTPYAPFCLMST